MKLLGRGSEGEPWQKIESGIPAGAGMGLQLVMEKANPKWGGLGEEGEGVSAMACGPLQTMTNCLSGRLLQADQSHSNMTGPP